VAQPITDLSEPNIFPLKTPKEIIGDVRNSRWNFYSVPYFIFDVSLDRLIGRARLWLRRHPHCYSDHCIDFQLLIFSAFLCQPTVTGDSYYTFTASNFLSDLCITQRIVNDVLH